MCNDGGKGRWGWRYVTSLFAVCRRSMIIGIRLVTTLAIR